MEYSTADLKSWMDASAEPVQESGTIREVAYLDRPTGHCPQFTRPADLATLILSSAPQ